MFQRLFRIVMQSAAIAALLTPVYLNIYTVPAGYYGLLKEIALGWQFPPLPAGRHWLWSGFVPEKWQLVLIPVNPPPLEIDFKHGLRYTDVLELDDSYRIRIKLRVQVRLAAEALPLWLRLSGENATKIPGIIEARLTALLQKQLLNLYRSDADIPRLKAALQNYFLRSAGSPFVSDWQQVMTEENILLAQLESWELLDIFVPDAAAYEMQTRNLAEVFAARRRALTENIFSRARVYEKQLLNRAEREHLEELRELLQQSPALRDYLKYDRLSKGNAPVTVIEDTSTSRGTSLPAGEGQVPPLRR